MNRYENYKGQGLTGLANVGNTCYLNSIIQVLSHTYELNDFLNKKKYRSKLNDIDESQIIIEWDNLRELMWSENCTIAPYGFYNAIQTIAELKDIDIFLGGQQNDVHEFLLFLIDCFHSSLAREVNMKISGIKKNNKDKLAIECYTMMKDMYKKEYSEILEIFTGIHISAISDLETNEYLSLKPEPFSVLHLDINNLTNTLYDCLEEYCKKEELRDDNAWLNEKTNTKINVNKGFLFWSFPKILIITLKRWNINGNKNQKYIDVPLDNVNLSKYVDGYNKEEYIYELYGVCNHSGNTNGGHYTANIKNANNIWYNYNDTIINEILEKDIITSKSYCLFYRKK